MHKHITIRVKNDMSNNKYKLPNVGEKIYDYTVIDNTLIPLIKPPKSKPDRKGVTVQCKCGTIEIVAIYDLHGGDYGQYRKKCYLCGKIKEAESKFTGIGNLSGTYIGIMKKGANERKLEYNVTKEFLWNLFLIQNHKCALSGVDIILRRLRKDSVQTASLDRIDSSKGYVEGNVQWVHKDINKIKMEFEQKEFIKLCQLVANHNKVPLTEKQA